MAELSAPSRPTDHLPASDGRAGDTRFAPDLPAVRRRQAPIYALLAGNAISLIGNQLAAVAIPWFVLQTTGSAGRTGLVAFCGLLPTILATLFGGVFADRIGHRRMSVISDLLSAGTVALIPLLHQTVGLPFALLLLLVFFGALFDGPGATSRASLVPEVATLAAWPLERANSAMQAIQSLAGLVGPLLAGLLIALIGESNVLWLDAVSFLVSAAAIGLIVPVAARSAAAARGRYRDELIAGWRFLAREPVLRAMALISTAINFLATPLFAVLLPVLANREYESAGALGLSLAAFGLGNLIGALAYGAFGHRFPRRPLAIGAFAVAAVPLLLLVLVPPPLVTAIAILLCGLGLGPLNPLAMTVMQERIPAELRARVFGALFAVSLLASPAGVLIAGGLTEWLGIAPVITGIAVGMLLLNVPMALSRGLRDLDATRPTAG